MMGQLAALDAMPDVGAPLVGDGGQFSSGLPAVNRAAEVASRIPGGVVEGLWTLPQRAMESSENMRLHGAYDPSPMVETAMNMMGTGAFAGVPARAGEAVLGAGPIRAYHGSPHDFEKFDLSKIGTGEGAQAYGHGLYFAENEGVARGYRDQLKHVTDTRDPAEIIASNFMNIHGDRDKALQQLERVLSTRRLPPGSQNRDLERAMSLLETNKPLIAGPTGHMYEVNINADPTHFLDWDKALSMDHGARGKLKDLAEIGLGAHEFGVDRQLAKDAFMQVSNPQLTGDGLYRQMTNAIEAARPVLKAQGNPRALFGGTAPMANEELVKAGIPGIKYLDQGSRGTGAGSSNYVVFNDKLIDIMRKYGIAAPVAIGALAAQDQYEP